MAAKIRKRIATFLRALAARLDRQPKPEPVPWVPSVAYNPVANTSSAAANAHVKFTHGGAQ